MTEPSPSPIPTTSSGPSWLDSLGPLNHLWQEQSFVVFVITALVLPLAIWLGKRAWKTWKRKRHAQRVAARRQQLPSARLPFTVEVGNQRLSLEPAQPQQNFAPEGMSIVRLLSARSTPVPFLDRAEALTRLEKWARSEERFAIHVLGGDGGSGKTRLGVELCRRLTTPNTRSRAAEVWQAGFLQNIEHSDSTSSSDDASSLLLVVDYAEARPDVVTEVINVALRAAEDPERKRVRIVFLVRRPSPLSSTRQGSNEWIDVLRPQDSKNEGINLILDESSTIVLNDEKLSIRERKELFEAAYRSFTEPQGSLPSSDVLEQLNDPLYSQPLLVTVDAFLNAHPLPNSQNSCSPDELFEEVLRHEERYWAEHWPSSLAVNTDRNQQSVAATISADTQGNFNRKLARQAVAAATLTDIQDEEDAISLLNLLPANPGTNTKDLAQWLRDCYPPHTDGNNHPSLWCEHLEPDRIGEHLVASESPDLDSLLRELLSIDRVGPSSLRTWIVLEHASTDVQLNERIGNILNDRLEEITQAVQEIVSITQTPDLATGLTKLFIALRSHIKPDKAHIAEQTLSKGGDLTAFLGCELAAHAANISRPADDAAEADRAAYASRKLSLSSHLANVGNNSEALKTAEEATSIYRDLAELNPHQYTSKYADSLNNLGLRLADSGIPRKALKVAQEATATYWGLTKIDPTTHTPDLAGSLINLTTLLAANRHQHEALEAAQAATKLYRALTEKNPASHTPNLAKTLNNLAAYLAEDGQQNAALRAAEESATINRELAKMSPITHTPDLAKCLNNLSLRLTENGQPHKAIGVSQESIEIYRGLSETNPTKYASELAKALNNLGLHLACVSQYDTALETTQEAVAIHRTLAMQVPASYTSDLAGSILNLSLRLAEKQQHFEALQAAEEATNLYAALVKELPAIHTPNFLNSLINLAACLDKCGASDRALTVARDASNGYRKLSETHGRIYSASFALSLKIYSFILEQLGDTKEASRIRQELDEFLRKTEEEDSDND